MNDSPVADSQGSNLYKLKKVQVREFEQTLSGFRAGVVPVSILMFDLYDP